MTNLNIHQYVLGIFADLDGYGVTVIGTNEEINNFWVFAHEHCDRVSLEHIKTTIDRFFEKYPQIRKIHINSSLENLQPQLNSYCKDRIYVGEPRQSPGCSPQGEIKSEVKIVELNISSQAFALKSYINDNKLIFNREILVEKDNLQEQINKFKQEDTNSRVFSLFMAISDIEPIKYRKFRVCAAWVG